MSFTLQDLQSYESQPQTQVASHDPWSPSKPDVKGSNETTPQINADADVDAAIAASVAEPTEKGTSNDGSTTDTQAEPVAAKAGTASNKQDLYSAKPEGDKDPDLEDLTDGKPRSRAQERIEELVAERNSLREYGKYLLDQVAEMRKSPIKSEQVSQTVAPQIQEDAAPTLEDAEFDPVKHSKMQTEWLNKQVEKRVENALKQFENRQSEVATRQAFEQRAAEFKKVNPDWEVVIANPALPPLAPEAARVVVRSENGPAITYHLAKNPDLAVRIARMEPISQAAAIGRLEEQLVRSKTDTSNTTKEPSKETKPAAKSAVKVTQAPPPPKPVSGGTSVTKQDGDPMSMEEWVSREREKKISERQARKNLRSAMR
jgi:hypothetical protein